MARNGGAKRRRLEKRGAGLLGGDDLDSPVPSHPILTTKITNTEKSEHRHEPLVIAPSPLKITA